MTPAEAVAYAIDHCFEQESWCPERKLVAAGPALRPGPRHAGAGRAPSCERQGVITGEMDGRLMATTREHPARGGLHRQPGPAKAVSTVGLPVGVTPGLERRQIARRRAMGRGHAGCSPPPTASAWSIPRRARAKSTMLAAYDRGHAAGRRERDLSRHHRSPRSRCCARTASTRRPSPASCVDEKMQDAARGRPRRRR